MSITRFITGALVAALFAAMLAMIFQNWLAMPQDTIDMLKVVIIAPSMAAILTAWRGWSEKDPPP